MDAEVKKDHPVCASEPDLSKLNSELTNENALKLIGKSMDSLDTDFTALKEEVPLSIKRKLEPLGLKNEAGEVLKEFDNVFTEKILVANPDHASALEMLAVDYDYAGNLLTQGQTRVQEFNETVKNQIQDSAIDKTSKMSAEVKEMCVTADNLGAEFQGIKKELGKMFK